MKSLFYEHSEWDDVNPDLRKIGEKINELKSIDSTGKININRPSLVKKINKLKEKFIVKNNAVLINIVLKKLEHPSAVKYDVLIMLGAL